MAYISRCKFQCSECPAFLSCMARNTQTCQGWASLLVLQFATDPLLPCSLFCLDLRVHPRSCSISYVCSLDHVDCLLVRARNPACTVHALAPRPRSQESRAPSKSSPRRPATTRTRRATTRNQKPRRAQRPAPGPWPCRAVVTEAAKLRPVFCFRSAEPAGHDPRPSPSPWTRR